MRSIYLEAQLLAAENRLFPGDPEFAMPALTVGANRTASASATIPAQLLHAISWIESKINQVHISVPYGDVGAALISSDCGYGIMQVTSTIDNDGGLPSRYEALAISHFAYNIAAGAGILAEKWNEDYFPVVGESDPGYVESWYFALWAYNGWAWINHPGNPAYDPQRPPYDCDDDESGYWDYPYQERVLGCVLNPPVVNGQQLWESHPVVLPDIPNLTAPGGALDPPAGQMTRDSHVEQVEPGRLRDDRARTAPAERLDHHTEQGVDEDLEVLLDGLGTHAAVPGHIAVVDQLAVAERERLEEPREGGRVARQTLLEHFLPEVVVDVSRERPPGCRGVVV